MIRLISFNQHSVFLRSLLYRSNVFMHKQVLNRAQDECNERCHTIVWGLPLELTCELLNTISCVSYQDMQAVLCVVCI